MRQDVVGDDLGQRGVTGVGDRETVGTVGARVDLGDLASRNEVGVLVALDFLLDIHRRGRRNVEVRRCVTDVVGGRAVLVHVESVDRAATDAVVRVAQALVLVRGLRAVAGHERHGVVRVLTSQSSGQRVHVEGRVQAALDRIRNVPADQGATSVVEVLLDLDRDLAQVVGGTVGVLQRGALLGDDRRGVVHVKALGQQVHDREGRGGATVGLRLGGAVDEEGGGLANDHGVGANGLVGLDAGELVAHAHPRAHVLVGGDDVTTVLVGHRAARAVLEAHVVRGGYVVVVPLGRVHRVVVRREVCGFGLREVRGDCAVQPRLGVRLRGGVRVDREAGDPLPLGQGQAGRLRVGDGLVVTLVGPVLQRPAAVVLVSGLAEDGETIGADHGRLVAGVAGSLGVLGGPGAGERVFPAEVQDRVTGVRAAEAPLGEVAARLVRPVVTGLRDPAARLAHGEAVRDLGTLRDDGRRVVHDLGGNGRLVGDRVSGRYRARGVLHGDG